MSERESRLVAAEDDPFERVDLTEEAEVTATGPVLARQLIDQHRGRWVLVRGVTGQQEVVAVADDLDELLRHPERRDGDVSAFVRDPGAEYG